MIIYPCGPYTWQARIRKHAAELEGVGHDCHPAWLFETSYDNDYVGWEKDRAMVDSRDIKAADILIAFTCPPDKGPARGGRHVEVGLALAWRKRVIIVGHRENIFMHLDQVEFYRYWKDCKAALQPVGGAEQWEDRWTSDLIAGSYR